MDDQFLHRLRREPPAGFALRLKRQLDRPAPLRPTRTHLILALAIFGTAFALTSPSLRHTVTQWIAPLTATVPRVEVAHRDDPAVTAESAPRVARSRTPVRGLRFSLPPTEPPPPAVPAITVDAAPVMATPSPAVSATMTTLTGTPEQRARAAAATRQGLFRVMGWVVAPLFAMARGEVPLDEQRLALSADRLQQLSSLIPEVFQSDTHLADVATMATPNIWIQRDDFAARADALTDAADALASAATDHDREASIKAILQISAACNTCHLAYRSTGK